MCLLMGKQGGDSMFSEAETETGQGTEWHRMGEAESPCKLYALAKLSRGRIHRFSLEDYTSTYTSTHRAMTARLL